MLKGWEDISLIENFIDSNFIGVYALSRNGLNVHYVGRDYDELVKRIENDAERDDCYRFFAYEYSLTDAFAYKLECKYYHECNPPDNNLHPSPPKGLNLQCPVKGCGSSKKIEAVKRI